MRSFTILLAVVSACLAMPSHPVTQWNAFKLAHGKFYDAEEEGVRFQIFSDNLKIIQGHNALHAAGLTTYKMAVNQFADLTLDEFKQYLALSGSGPVLTSDEDVFPAPEDTSALPESVDYRQKGAVNAVKNQKSCGSCWAFSTVAVLESHHFLRNGTLLSLSEQNLVDCSSSYGNHGCSGGLMSNGYNYIRDHGIETEEEYPYLAYDSSCKFRPADSVMTVKGYTAIQAKSESALQAAVATVGPVAVAVDASQWRFYHSGIFKTSGRYGLNHGVAAVGYGTEELQDYWIVRNSWGPTWGEQGYIRVARNADNQIGITDMACFPNL